MLGTTVGTLALHQGVSATVASLSYAYADDGDLITKDQTLMEVRDAPWSVVTEKRQKFHLLDDPGWPAARGSESIATAANDRMWPAVKSDEISRGVQQVAASLLRLLLLCLASAHEHKDLSLRAARYSRAIATAASFVPR